MGRGEHKQANSWEQIEGCRAEREYRGHKAVRGGCGRGCAGHTQGEALCFLSTSHLIAPQFWLRVSVDAHLILPLGITVVTPNLSGKEAGWH